jgi:hypothetical protein
MNPRSHALRIPQIEAWAYDVIARVKAVQPNEDARVELKREWPVPEKVARQIAGHANPARGAPILWLIGVDQKTGVVGADPKELANWFSAVRRQFESVWPSLTDVNIPVDGVTVVALLFETDRAPFVVNNPDGGHIQYEVPWREGTSTRTAKRDELLRLLGPVVHLPSCEVMKGSLELSRTEDESPSSPRRWTWEIQLWLRLVPVTEERVSIPFHRCMAKVMTVPGYPDGLEFPELSLVPQNTTTLASTGHEVLITGPGIVRVYGKLAIASGDVTKMTQVDIVATLLPDGTNHPISVTGTWELTPAGRYCISRWATWVDDREDD